MQKFSKAENFWREMVLFLEIKEFFDILDTLLINEKDLRKSFSQKYWLDNGTDFPERL